MSGNVLCAGAKPSRLTAKHPTTSTKSEDRPGSGADTIVQGWDDAKFGTPVISEKSEPNKVELTLPIISDGDCNAESNGTSNAESNGDSNGDSLGLKEIRELIANRKKVSYEDSSRIICELCHDWIGARELASTLGFSLSHIKSKILPRMIADGLLEPYDKQSPKSPEQKYRAIPQN